jgi:dTDP-4-dehydrorhamnose 3,5-epimerase
MNVSATALAGLFSVGTEPISDRRGSFSRLFCRDELASVFGSRQIVQINHSRTVDPGAVRGLHFQYAPHAEMKLVRCLAGRVWDVVVDLRAGSSTFLQWHAEELSPSNGRMLVVPEGCAHGFQALEPQSELLYLHTASYAAKAEGGVRADDPRLAIRWPLPITGQSERDRSHPLLGNEFAGVRV